METTLFGILCRGSALIAGGAVGSAFALLQNMALRRHEKLEQSGKLKNGWSLMPGAGARVAYFLIALLLVQICCPVLFADGTQWWVSGGVAVGYGWFLARQLRQRLAQRSRS